MRKSLITNKSHKDNIQRREFDPPLRNKVTNCKSRLLSSILKVNANRVPKLYTDPRLVQGERWYIEFYFRHPSGEMKRFRLFEQVNKKKLSDAAAILSALKQSLEEGYNPFSEPEEEQKSWTIQQGILYYKQTVADRGLEHESLRKYNRTIDRFIMWLQEKNLQFKDPDEIKTHHIESYLLQMKTKGKWTNRGYNNELEFTSSIFIFLKSKGIIKVNPCTDVSTQKTVSKKHKFYDEKTLNRVVELMKQHEPYLYFACQVVYYLCIRSEKELKYFKVGNIFPERKQVLISGSDSKTDQDRFIPCAEKMMDIFKEQGVLNYPPDCYVFSISGKPSDKPFGKAYFSKRFAKIRKLAGLSSDYTIFSFRHTRAVHMKMDGARDEQIMNIMGHTDFATTASYLRDLGLTVSGEDIDKKTRKF